MANKVLTPLETSAQISTINSTLDRAAYTDVSNTFSQKQNFVANDVYDLYEDGAAVHNSIYRGKDITDDFNDGTFSTNVANGSFRDIFIGDYITKTITDLTGTTRKENFIIAECDGWLNHGDTACTTHHCIIVPESILGTSYMNSSNTTNGGYVGSYMYKTIIPKCSTIYKNAFGSTHILQFRDLLTNSINAGLINRFGSSGGGTNNWEWYDATCNLMSEIMVYGSISWASTGYDSGRYPHQLALFRFNKEATLAGRQWYWLSDVASSSDFAHAHGDGIANSSVASYVFGVLPIALVF